jgi:hypothetical protein
VLAGLTLAAMNVPQALGYTKIAGMPLVTGLYTLLLPLVAFAALGSSRYLVVAADSATAAILAGGLAPMAELASPRYVELAGLVALLTAAYLLLARLFRLGFLADFLSQTVLVGFLTGVGVQVGIAVLDEMLGLPSDAHGTLREIADLVRVCRRRIRRQWPCRRRWWPWSSSVAASRRAFPARSWRSAPRCSPAPPSTSPARGIRVIGPVEGGLPALTLRCSTGATSSPCCRSRAPASW